MRLETWLAVSLAGFVPDANETDIFDEPQSVGHQEAGR